MFAPFKRLPEISSPKEVEPPSKVNQIDFSRSQCFLLLSLSDYSYADNDWLSICSIKMVACSNAPQPVLIILTTVATNDYFH